MQSDHKQVYKLTSDRTGKSEQRYKDLGSFVFTELYNMVKRPKSLITKLKGVGQWYLRKKRMDIVINMYPPNYEKIREDFSTESGFLKSENKKEVYELFKVRLEEYKEYIKLKDEIRKLRNETQVLLRPDKREDESQESSKIDT